MAKCDFDIDVSMLNEVRDDLSEQIRSMDKSIRNHTTIINDTGKTLNFRYSDEGVHITIASERLSPIKRLFKRVFGNG